MSGTSGIRVTALAATCLDVFVPFAEPPSSARVPSAQESKAVRVGVIPDPAFVERPENWIAYNAPLYAPAAGRIVSVANDVPDNRIANGRLIYPEPSNDVVKRLFGNVVLIEHGGGEYSLLAHLKAGTVTVGLNDRVEQDQLVGRIGFSGDTGLIHTGELIER